MHSNLLASLKKGTNAFVALGTALLFFDLNYYLMANLIGTRNLMCVIGAGLTVENFAFSIAISSLVGLMASGFIELRKKHKNTLAVSSTSGLGALLGIFTLFCPICTIPVLSVFGASVGLSFFTTYNLVFKIIALFLMLIAVYMLDGRLDEECAVCKR